LRRWHLIGGAIDLRTRQVLTKVKPTGRKRSACSADPFNPARKVFQLIHDYRRNVLLGGRMDVGRFLFLWRDFRVSVSNLLQRQSESACNVTRVPSPAQEPHDFSIARLTNQVKAGG
jgi:hypothetical protein